MSEAEQFTQEDAQQAFNDWLTTHERVPFGDLNFRLTPINGKPVAELVPPWSDQ